jgi:CDP-6-deoxy-D-xylo-4-hexulose-3-dehydrase
MTADDLRKQIRALVTQYAEVQFAPAPFVAGESIIPPSGKVIGAPEIELMVEA